jgi:hypothetical protein
MREKTPNLKLNYNIHIQNGSDYREFYKHNSKEL